VKWLFPTVHPWCCETCSYTTNLQFWMKECDIFRGRGSKHTLTHPTYFQGGQDPLTPGSTPLIWLLAAALLDSVPVVHLSCRRHYRHGVKEGGVLSPVLFCVYICKGEEFRNSLVLLVVINFHSLSRFHHASTATRLFTFPRTTSRDHVRHRFSEAKETKLPSMKEE